MLDSRRLADNIKRRVEGILHVSIKDMRIIDAICEAIVEEIQVNLEATEVDVNLGGEQNNNLYVDPAPVVPPTQDANTSVPVNPTKQPVKGRTKVGVIHPGKLK